MSTGGGSDSVTGPSNANVMQHVSLDELTARAEALCTKDRRCILGLAGSPGAGKSTVAARLVERLGERAVLVPMDGFHLANSELRRLGRADRKGAYDTFDGAGYVALLERLRRPADETVVYAPEFRRDLEEAIAGAIAVSPRTPLVVTEGNYLLLDREPWSRVRALLDQAWFIALDPAVRLQRLIARHIEFGRDEPAARAWIDASDEPNARLIEATRERADAVIALAETNE